MDGGVSILQGERSFGLGVGYPAVQALPQAGLAEPTAVAEPAGGQGVAAGGKHPGPHAMQAWSEPASNGHQELHPGSGSLRREQVHLKTQWKAQQAALRQKQLLLAKAERFCPELLAQVAADLDHAKRLEEERINLRDELSGHIEGLRGASAALQAHMAHVVPGPKYIAELTEIMDFGERQITLVKEVQRQRFDALLKEELLLSREVESFAERLQAPGWESAPLDEAGPSSASPTSTVGRPRVPRLVAQGDPVTDEVAALDAFVAAHGPFGGWEEDDDRAFGRALARAKGDYSRVVELALADLPHATRQQVVAHARWHAEHEDLQLKKRIAIQRWRADKESKRLAALSRCTAPESASDAAGKREVTESERRAARQEEKRKLEEWRAKKREAEAVAQAARAAAEQQAEDERRAQVAERRRVAKEQLQRFKEIKAEQEMARAAAVATSGGGTGGRPKSAGPADLRLLQQRDREIAARRAAALAAKEREAGLRERRQSQLRGEVKVAAVRDPSRLLRPTKAAELRRAAQRDEEAFGSVPSAIGLVSHKAAPAWRAPLVGQ